MKKGARVECVRLCIGPERFAPDEPRTLAPSVSVGMACLDFPEGGRSRVLLPESFAW